MQSDDMMSAIEKAKKLLRLIEGATTDKEAAAASAALQRHLAHHGLTMADLDSGMAKDTEDTKPEETDVFTSGAGIPRWLAALARYVAEAYRCSSYMASGYDMDAFERYHKIQMLGMPEDVALASKVFGATVKAAKNCWHEWSAQAKPCMEARGYVWNAGRFRNGYYTGFAHGIGAAYKENVKNDASVSLMVVKPQAVVKAVEDLHLGTHHWGASHISGNAYRSGYQAGYGVGKGNMVEA